MLKSGGITRNTAHRPDKDGATFPTSTCSTYLQTWVLHSQLHGREQPRNLVPVRIVPHGHMLPPTPLGVKQAEAPVQHAMRREQCITPWLVRGCAPHPGGDFPWFSARLIISALWCLDKYLACVLSQDFDTPLSVLLALKNYYSNHQLTSGLWSQFEDHFRWITSTLADMVPVRVVTRVSVSPADLDHSLP